MKKILLSNAVILISLVLSVSSIRSSAAQSNAGSVGVVEHLGRTVPLDLVFSDEEGQALTLGSLLDRPTILALVYFRCPSICSPLLNGLVEALERIDLLPALDYRVVTISFDPSDLAETAKQKRANYLKQFRRTFPEEGWRFLTGTAESIAAITEAVGFKYRQLGNDFDHPAVISTLSGKGVISRYFNGVTFLPFDLKLGLFEAGRGETGPTINKVLLYCYSYDPESKRYAFDIIKVSGSVTLLVAFSFAIFLFITSRRTKEKG